MSIHQFTRCAVAVLALTCIPFARCQGSARSETTLQAVVSTFILENRFDKQLKAAAIPYVAAAIDEPLNLRIARGYYVQTRGYSVLTAEYMKLSNDSEIMNIKACLKIDHFRDWLKLRSETLAYDIKIGLFQMMEGSETGADWAGEVARIMDMLEASETAELRDLRKQVADQMRPILFGNPALTTPFVQAIDIVQKAGKSRQRLKAIEDIRSSHKK